MARGAASIFRQAKSLRRQPTFSPLDKSRRVFLFAFLSLVVLASGCAIFYIATHIQAVNLGYKIGQELQRKEQLIEDNKRLSLEIARLKSPTRIEAEAKETLGLELPKTQQVFYLSRWEPDSLVKVAAAGTPGTAKPGPVKPGAIPASPDKPAEKAPAPQPEAKTLAKKTENSPALKPSEGPKVAKAEPAAPKTATAKPQPAKTPTATQAVEPEKIAKLEKPAGAKPSLKSLQAKPFAKPATPEPKLALNSETTKPASNAKQQPVKAEAIAKPEATVATKPKPAEKSVAAGKEAPATVAKKPEAGKQETAKAAAPKSSAKPVAQESRVAKRETSDILVAKIVDKESSREKSPNKLKSGPSLAYQPKEKVPAVMLDPMP